MPVRALSTIFRGKCTQALPQADLLGDVPAHVWRKPWVTHGQPAGPGTAVLASLAPSIRRLALTTNRIETLEDGHGTFRFQESANNQWQRRTLPAKACLRRFLPHVLPQGFITVRDYGFLSPTCRPSLTPIRPLLTASACHLPLLHDGENPQPHEPRMAHAAGGSSSSWGISPAPNERHHDHTQPRRSCGILVSTRRA